MDMIELFATIGMCFVGYHVVKWAGARFHWQSSHGDCMCGAGENCPKVLKQKAQIAQRIAQQNAEAQRNTEAREAAMGAAGWFSDECPAGPAIGLNPWDGKPPTAQECSEARLARAAREAREVRRAARARWDGKGIGPPLA